MKKRIPYLVAAGVLLILEILIALYAKDDFIRPYGGDILVTPLLCCLIRLVFPDKFPRLSLWVFVFSVCVELFQLVPKPSLEGTWLGILIGTSFSFWDIVCYALGCAAFSLTERFCGKG